MPLLFNWILTLIFAFYIRVLQIEGFHNLDLRVLIVGGRNSAPPSVVNTLLGRKDQRQEDRQMMKSEVMTDEGRAMMLVTGPNLCEKNPASRDFKTVLTLSSPGPHAVLITLDLEDLQSEECDLLQQVQELLGTQVLRYCIVLLLQNDPEKPDRNTERVGEIIDACRGRFHIITDSEPKPAQTTALLEEIHKLVWLNGETFYSTLNEMQQLETERLELLERLEDEASRDSVRHSQ
ncbi:GTPase IMAP family member 6-like [Xyrauchen texanus]|uniref:GTPase IMAP family member 6-like n=1 Tax=Xyrauchen texanus TaxID=154827 RepID=UPI002242095E|nr:GTPase IMAP family member 6-like [Xyrauchen texanus]